jgi:steroid 5-alpha reductase family enzyme
MWAFVLDSAAAVFVYMTAVFIIALVKKDNSVVDVAWGPGFIVVAVLTLFLEKGIEARQVLITGLVLVWGVRLAAHIFVRNRGKGEDFRYAKWRREWGRWFIPRSFFQIFMLQGVFLLLIVSPVIIVNRSSVAGLSLLDAGGAAVWLVGFLFETVGDHQLRQFKKSAAGRGKIMTGGLWKFTRHPNYFGEAAAWWGVYIIALSVPYGWAAIVSPLTITFLLLKVSGIPMLEKKYAGNPDFAAYASRTSPFFPWFPKKS